MTSEASTWQRFLLPMEVYSFLLFCLLTTLAFVLLPGFFVVFLIIVEVDGIGTLINSDTAVSVDRSVFFLALVILTVAEGGFGLLFLFAEVVLTVVALDFTFLLRRVRGTAVDTAVFRRRLDSYAFTAVPAFVSAYALTLVYSTISGISLPDPLALLVVSATAALLSVYAVSRYFSSRVEPVGRG